MAKPVRVLLLSDDDQRRQEWTQMLEKAVELWPGSDDGGSALPEVVVTDRLPIEETPDGVGPALAHGAIGILAVASSGQADVVLPNDYTGRELCLACRLLAEIIRLRRRRHNDKRAQRALRRLAFSDPLTGLANRRVWDEQLAVRCREPCEDRSLCVALLDLDLFKSINDRLGHVAGDEVLRTVARRMTTSLRHPDLVARGGGDEFALLLNGVERSNGWARVDQLRRGIKHVAQADDRSITVTASAGFVFVRESCSDVAAMAAADRALRQAKTGGRNRTIQGELPH